jgi:hypothetical protein
LVAYQLHAARVASDRFEVREGADHEHLPRGDPGDQLLRCRVPRTGVGPDVRQAVDAGVHGDGGVLGGDGVGDGSQPLGMGGLHEGGDGVGPQDRELRPQDRPAVDHDLQVVGFWPSSSTPSRRPHCALAARRTSSTMPTPATPDPTRPGYAVISNWPIQP